ncbi:ribonuclease D [Dokdonella sp.]|uniref:ribonuclease D n=1 Tax=Dokdonella sp. TaxID=2291710 RepID=UPI0027B9A654|nr:ribonuclease D [Dokdonella sp.]
MTDWITRDDALQALLEHTPATLGLDTEFMRTNTFLPRLALVQADVGGRIALVDPTAPLDPAPLARVLADPARTIVMHSASEDLEALATWSCDIAHLFDTQIAAAFAGLGAGLGYQKLVFELTGIALPKTETRSDWLQRPLSAQQIDYAAQDVLHLPRLHEELARRLEQRNMSAWLAADCERLLAKAREREPDPQPQLALRGAADWPRERQALLRRLLRWRDAAARRHDRPRNWLLDDAHALDLAAQPPRSAEELAERTRGLRALRSAQREELLAVVQAPLRDEDLDFVPIPPQPDARERKLIAAMKEVVAAQAQRLDLPDALLCSRRHLETLLATRCWPIALDGWRRDLLHDELLALLPS